MLLASAILIASLGAQEDLKAKIPPYPNLMETLAWNVEVDFSVGGNTALTKFELSTVGATKDGIVEFPYVLSGIEATLNGSKMEFPEKAEMSISYQNGAVISVSGTLPLIDPQRLALCCIFTTPENPFFTTKAVTWAHPDPEKESNLPYFERTVSLVSIEKTALGNLNKMAVKYRELKKTTFMASGYVWIYDNGSIHKSELTLKDLPIPTMGVKVDGKITMSLKIKGDKQKNY